MRSLPIMPIPPAAMAITPIITPAKPPSITSSITAIETDWAAAVRRRRADRLCDGLGILADGTNAYAALQLAAFQKRIDPPGDQVGMQHADGGGDAFVAQHLPSCRLEMGGYVFLYVHAIPPATTRIGPFGP